MKFSLILATLGRREEVELFIKSLLKQTYKNFELIIVDQNTDDFVFKIYDKYKKLINIKYIKIDKKGLSIARNIGLKLVEGDIVAFPDDDCEYMDDTLNRVLNTFVENNNCRIVTGKSIDKVTKIDSSISWKSSNCRLTYHNIYKTSISYTIFIKFKNLQDIIFDELLGVGAKYGAGEESDMLLSLLHKSYMGQYNKEIVVFHPIKGENPNRTYSYAQGAGALLKKEFIGRRNISYFFRVINNIIIKPIIHLLIELITFNKSKFEFHKLVFKGKMSGFINYKV